jgi:hypothetical protein
MILLRGLLGSAGIERKEVLLRNLMNVATAQVDLVPSAEGRRPARLK